jgi:hypothetical protein
MAIGKVARYLALSLCLVTLTAGHEQHAFGDQQQEISEDRLADLQRKWNDEVNKSLLSWIILVAYIEIVGIFWDLDICASAASKVSRSSAGIIRHRHYWISI